MAMRIAYIWYNEAELATTEAIISEQRPDWKVDYIPEHLVWDLLAVLKLLDAGYEAILVHLSLPYCLALKMAEVAHRANKSTKIILYSLTAADPQSIDMLFDGRIHPDNDLAILTERISAIVSSKRTSSLSDEQIKTSIVAIFNSSGVLKSSFVNCFNERHKETFSYADYRHAVQASLTAANQRNSENFAHDVFLSYASKNHNVAEELKTLLEKAGISCFMASIDINAGDVWEHEIKQALVGAREVLIVLTQESIKSSWVLIEAGAAWSLGKRITPCMFSANTDDIPEPISKHQARSIVTQKDKKDLVGQLKKRLKERDAGRPNIRSSGRGQR
jgi:hypothetical protein